MSGRLWGRRIKRIKVKSVVKYWEKAVSDKVCKPISTSYPLLMRALGVEIGLHTLAMFIGEPQTAES